MLPSILLCRRWFEYYYHTGLLAFFFDPKSELDILTKNYGVF